MGKLIVDSSRGSGHNGELVCKEDTVRNVDELFVSELFSVCKEIIFKAYKGNVQAKLGEIFLEIVPRNGTGRIKGTNGIDDAALNESLELLFKSGIIGNVGEYGIERAALYKVGKYRHFTGSNVRMVSNSLDGGAGGDADRTCVYGRLLGGGGSVKSIVDNGAGGNGSQINVRTLFEVSAGGNACLGSNCRDCRNNVAHTGNPCIIIVEVGACSSVNGSVYTAVDVAKLSYVVIYVNTAGAVYAVVLLTIRAVSLCGLVACTVVFRAVVLLNAGGGIIGVGYVIALAAGIIVLLAKSAVKLVYVMLSAEIIANAAVDKALAGAVVVNVYAALAEVAVVSVAVLAMESGYVAVLVTFLSVGELNDNTGAVSLFDTVSTANAVLAVIFAAESAEGELAVISVNSASVNGSYVDMLFTSGAMVIKAGQAPVNTVLTAAIGASGTAHGVPSAGIVGVVAMPGGRRIINYGRTAVIYQSACGAVELTVYNKVGIENYASAYHNVNGNVGGDNRKTRYGNRAVDGYVIRLSEILVTCKIRREFGRYSCKGSERHYGQDHQRCKNKREKFSFHDNLLRNIFRTPIRGVLFIDCIFHVKIRLKTN